MILDVKAALKLERKKKKKTGEYLFYLELHKSNYVVRYLVLDQLLVKLIILLLLWK